MIMLWRKKCFAPAAIRFMTRSVFMQQCAEKYLKAFLQEQERDVPKTHKLLDLLKLCKEVDSTLEILLPDLREIERFSVNIRYPGMSADKDEAKMAFKAVQVVRSLIKGYL
jgi:HEPN domain-containing protein